LTKRESQLRINIVFPRQKALENIVDEAPFL
jgi:hypothetical protein